MTSKNSVSAEESDLLQIRPLGAGQEVGRSCIMLEFKGKTIMLDCGIHPGLSNIDALPYIDTIESDEVDLLLVSHFHLDHCGALPWFLTKTGFRGRCFMTHATKAIYRWMLSDYIKISNISADQMLYTETDLEASMEKIETVNFHEERDVMGIRFSAYNAGHVLGAAMFMIEIAGVKILYTGDFSRQEDRHLMAAEVPPIKPDVVITESTYGTHVHENREDREERFTTLVSKIVMQGGRCLIPVFALGRAQELLLILDEYWSNNPHLQDIPIYYASSLAKKCMTVYQTYINAMNDKIRQQIAVSNPFVFRHISNLKSIDHFEDVGPCVIMASPGMMQSGLSRELFEMWCTDSKNGVIIAGYCVEGTLAKTILSEPEEITTTSGEKLALNMSVDYISFSAHTDYHQTRDFLRELQPQHVVLVHGEQNEMMRLKVALEREYAAEGNTTIKFYNPRNTHNVDLYFRGEKTAKVMGTLAEKPATENSVLSGVVVKRDFKYHIMAPTDLSKYTSMTMSTITQRQTIPWSGSLGVLEALLNRIGGAGTVQLTPEDANSLRAFDCIDVRVENKLLILEWDANPMNDMYADTVLACVMQTELGGTSVKGAVTSYKSGKAHFKECVLETLQDFFGKEAIPPSFDGDIVPITISGKKSQVNLDTLEIDCDDADLYKIIQTTVQNLHNALVRPKTNNKTA